MTKRGLYHIKNRVGVTTHSKSHPLGFFSKKNRKKKSRRSFNLMNNKIKKNLLENFRYRNQTQPICPDLSKIIQRNIKSLSKSQSRIKKPIVAVRTPSKIESSCTERTHINKATFGLNIQTTTESRNSNLKFSSTDIKNNDRKIMKNFDLNSTYTHTAIARTPKQKCKSFSNSLRILGRGVQNMKHKLIQYQRQIEKQNYNKEQVSPLNDLLLKTEKYDGDRAQVELIITRKKKRNKSILSNIWRTLAE
mmetsp:Transcript_11719/g.10352  ORF Transcript_11719/g.10352 Transcript_11719/m.10352 type:complete len:249 (+) Transcript_11719:147-893(+)